jgi:hypothetical protein
VEARIPLLKLLNDFLTNSYVLFENAKASKVIVSDGVVNKNLAVGVHVLWLE